LIELIKKPVECQDEAFTDKIKAVYADKAYDTKEIRDFIAKLDICVRIPKNIRNNKSKK
jgi:hypothetical protein